jgi:hypothetical protein
MDDDILGYWTSTDRLSNSGMLNLDSARIDAIEWIFAGRHQADCDSCRQPCTVVRIVGDLTTPHNPYM